MPNKNKILLYSPIPPVLGSTIVYLLSGGSNLAVNNSSNQNETSTTQSEEGAKTPEVKKYKDYFKENHFIGVVDENTQIPHLKGIILQDTNPAIYENKKLYEKGKLFEGSPEINLKVKERIVDKKKIQVLDMDDQALAYKKACLTLLDQELDQEHKHLEGLKKGCVSPIIKDIATKWGFKLHDDDSSDNIKTNRGLTKEDGVTYSDYAKQHQFIKQADYESAKNDSSRRLKLMFSCTPNYRRPYSVNDVPAVDLTKMDYFQQVTMFCGEVVNAGDYLSQQLKVNDFNEVNDQDKDNYFYQQDKDINYYKSIKTSDPMDGKSFGGAVRFLYGKRKDKAI